MMGRKSFFFPFVFSICLRNWLDLTRKQQSMEILNFELHDGISHQNDSFSPLSDKCLLLNEIHMNSINFMLIFLKENNFVTIIFQEFFKRYFVLTCYYIHQEVVFGEIRFKVKFSFSVHAANRKPGNLWLKLLNKKTQYTWM